MGHCVLLLAKKKYMRTMSCLLVVIVAFLFLGRTKAEKLLFQSEFDALGCQVMVLPDPNHHWNMNGDALDSIGDADGTPVGGTVTYSAESVDGGQALVLTNGNFLEMTSSSLKQEINGYYAIAMWFKVTTTLDGIRNLYEEGGARNGIAIRINGNHVESLCYSLDQQTDVKVARALGTIQANRWHHVLALFDGSQQKLHVFVDGRNKGTKDTGLSSIPFHANPASIGGLGPHGARTAFQGLADALSIWKDVLFTDEEVQALYERNEPSQMPLPPSFYWSFEGDLDDYSDLANGATYSSDAVQGSASLYLPHDGSVIFSHPDLRLAFSMFSVSLFFKEDGGSVGTDIRYLFETGGTQNGLAIRLNQGTVEVACKRNGGSEDAVSVGLAVPGLWHHVVGVFDKGTLRVVLDGSSIQEVDVGYGDIPQHSNPTSLGGVGLSGAPDDGHFVGHIDEVKVWINNALSLKEIEWLYNEQSPQELTSTPNSSRPTSTPTGRQPSLSPTSDQTSACSIQEAVAEDCTNDNFLFWSSGLSHNTNGGTLATISESSCCDSAYPGMRDLDKDFHYVDFVPSSASSGHDGQMVGYPESGECATWRADLLTAYNTVFCQPGSFILAAYERDTFDPNDMSVGYLGSAVLQDQVTVFSFHVDPGVAYQPILLAAVPTTESINCGPLVRFSRVVQGDARCVETNLAF